MFANVTSLEFVLPPPSTFSNALFQIAHKHIWKRKRGRCPAHVSPRYAQHFDPSQPNARTLTMKGNPAVFLRQSDLHSNKPNLYNFLF